jgi:hypothetical protein
MQRKASHFLIRFMACKTFVKEALQISPSKKRLENAQAFRLLTIITYLFKLPIWASA